MFTELLAPAKDKETAFSAIDCGADAVYIGASAFGARKNASNTLDDIKEVIDYAHKYWARVFVTINTILTDKEVEEALELVKKLDAMMADAIIIQDMGLLKRIMDEKLTIPVHISTQCDDRDIEKVSFFNKLGVSRVVLARELSLKQINEIHDANPDLELEAFVHGALCVSYSGQCYLSRYIGGRSANRGECAQPCRKKYSVETEDGRVIAKDIYALCLKDFNASPHLKQMIDAGVFSFKIEGRLKDADYVKNITAYYRQELDKYSKKTSSGRCVYSFVPNPEKSFNRGFTDYFLTGRNDCFSFKSPKSIGEYLGKIVDVKKDCFKIDTDKIINPQDGLTDGIDGILVNKSVNGYIYPNRKINFTKGTIIYRNFDSAFDKELQKPVKRQIGVNITAERDYLYIEDENNISIKAKLPQGEKAQNSSRMQETFVKQFSKTGESDFYINNIDIKTELPFMPVGEINALRREVFDKLMDERVKQYKRSIQKEMNYTQYYKKAVDYRANVHNKYALEFYQNCGVTVLEKSLESSVPSRSIELMRTKHCIKYALNLCKSNINLVLKDEFGKKYPLKFDCKNCEMAVLNK